MNNNNIDLLYIIIKIINNIFEVNYLNMKNNFFDW